MEKRESIKVTSEMEDAGVRVLINSGRWESTSVGVARLVVAEIFREMLDHLPQSIGKQNHIVAKGIE
jgi:hypothetical protein